MQIQEWLNQNKIQYIIRSGNLPESINDIYIIDINFIGKFLLIKEKEIEYGEKGGQFKKVIFDKNFNFILNDEEKEIIKNTELYGIIYYFGGKFYYDKIGDLKSPKLNLLKYIGNCDQLLEDEFTPLGIHGKYEILSGSRDYIHWCKKNLFYGYKSLGICEKNTLAGTLQFQLECDKINIKSILGETISIKRDDIIFEGKVYCLSEQGWENLLLINKEINVTNFEERFIKEEDLLKLGKGLIFVFTTTKNLTYYNYELYSRSFSGIFFQIDSIIWQNKKQDKEYLLELKEYVEKYMKFIEPILINDSYYLDKEDNYIRPFLNKLKGGGFLASSKNQYFKNLDDNFIILNKLFKDEDKFQQIFDLAVANTIKLTNLVEFKIPTKGTHLPEFEITDLSEKKYEQFKTNEDLFHYLIEEGLEKHGKNITDNEFEIWLKRLEIEIEVIKKGKFIDYFLILWDIIRWCEEKNILTGIGRGSSGGSLVSYLLGITKINPLQYDLLFERFLSKDRKSLPDIDVDFESKHRDEVKAYIEKRYGSEYFCSIGTYTTLQIKQAIKDLSKTKGVEYSKANYLTNSLNLRTGDWKDIFENALGKTVVYNFVKEYPELINDIPLCLNSPKASSIHPCATIILPKDKNKNIFNTLPVRIEDGVLVSEWEGNEIADAGYLKEDILGIRQLDKFKFILILIKETTGEKVDIYNINTKDPKVFDLFQHGHNSDVFHFGSALLSSYSREVQPESLEDLIAMISLVRPGAMQSGAHNDYVNLKKGIKRPVYDYGLREVTEKTYGLYIYQEQIMKSVTILGGFEPYESTAVLKAMGKLRRDILEPYEKRFIEGALNNGCKEEEAQKIWNKLVGFADYGFNKSHAAAYSMTGYICNWFKANYPIQFWAAAFEFEDKEENINRYISEIKKIDNHIKIVPPDINRSGKSFYIDFQQSKIYWSLISIYCVGEVAINEIIKKRELGGSYFSLKDFLSRIDKAFVDKGVIENLILCGAFDETCEIKNIVDRLKIIKEFYEIRNIKEKDWNSWVGGIDALLKLNKADEFDFLLKQKELSGLGDFDFKELLERSTLKHLKNIYCDEIDFFEVNKENKRVIIGGIITSIRENTSKKGLMGQIEIDSNYEKIRITYWSKVWEKDKKYFTQEKIGKFLLISGRVTFNPFNNQNTLQIEDDVEYQIFE